MTLICDGVLGKLKVWMGCDQYKFSSLTLALIESNLRHSFLFIFLVNEFIFPQCIFH